MPDGFADAVAARDAMNESNASSGAALVPVATWCALWNGRMLLETGICAWKRGVVTEAADGAGPAGTAVSIDHGGGWVSRYFHLEAGSLRVGPGDGVEEGTLLGWMGKTGRATGEHLHFQLERDGVPVDPLPLIAR